MTCCDTKHPMISKGGFSACVPGALPGGLSRTRFFDGMILTQADLENEQRYWRVKRRLTNRALGTGVVWGLRLQWDARRRLFALGPGYALDCCGNDLIVECPLEISEASLLDTADPAIRGGAADSRIVRRASAPLTHACVVLQYVECPEDARPVHLDPCAPPSSRCEPSRIRETARLLLVPPPAPPEPNCLDDVFADLEALKSSIPEPLRSQLFPPAAPPAPTPAFATQLPATLRVVTPGTGATTEVTIQPPAVGITPAVSVSGTRTPDGLRAGLVQFELRPWTDWGFYQGQVKDGSAVVDIVAPPLDLQQFWALEITLPPNTEKVTDSFTYVVDSLGLEQMFGDHAHGIAQLVIRGRVVVSAADAGQVTTTVEGLTVEVKSEVGAGEGVAGCFDELVPWGLMEDPATGERDAKLLLLAAIYAYFADVTSTSGGAWTPAKVWAAQIYTVAWKLLGVDLTIPNAEAQKLELAKILSRLFECWCDAMLYPGPRCTDEHHGVYLGCAAIAPGGRILSFDMWEHRRHVLLGPLVNHWLGVFGLAPIDVVAARIAQAICCVAGLPLPASVPTDPQNDGGVVLFGRGRLSVGPRTGGAENLAVRDVGVADLIRRMVGGFVADSGAPLERVRARTRAGTVVELVAPGTGAGAGTTRGAIEPSIDDVLRRGEALPPLARTTTRTAIAELAREVEATALPELRGGAAELAKRLAGRSLADLIELGPDGLLAAVPDADPAAVDELATRADAALAGLAEGVGAAARKPAPARPSAVLRDADLRKAVAADAKKRFGLTRARVDAALDRAAARAP